jgi:signal peptidase I
MTVMNGTLKNLLAEVWDFAKTLLFFMTIIVLLRVFVFTTYDVSGQSMLPNFHDKERLIVSKLAYQIGKPERFDVIVFHATKDEDFIKRIIGLPGDRIRYKDDVLYINDKPVKERFLTDIKKSYKGKYTNDFTLEEVLHAEKVPEGHVFVLGDNRPISKDSRFAEVGFVPIDKIVGKVEIRYLPLSHFTLNVSGNKAIAKPVSE